MFKPFVSLFTQSHKGHLALTAAAALVALTAPSAGAAASSPVAAVGTVDQSFTITAMKSSSGAGARVLGVGPGGAVQLQRPAPGSAAQRWAPALLGQTPASSFEACLDGMGCPFTSIAPTSTRAIVNLETGTCLTTAGRRLVVAGCAADAADERQRFHWNFSDAEIASTGLPSRYTALATENEGRLRCATSTPPTAGHAAQPTKAAPCTNRLRWEQQYRFTPAG